MNRRQALAALGSITAAAATAAGIEAKIDLVEKEPMPLLAVLSLDKDHRSLTPYEVEHISRQWLCLWNGNPPFRIAVLQPGMKLDVIRDPRERIEYIRNCSACGKDHALTFHPAVEPSDGWDWQATCLHTGRTVWMRDDVNKEP